MSKANGSKKFLYVVVTRNMQNEPTIDAHIIRSEQEPTRDQVVELFDLDFDEISEVVRLDEDEIIELPPKPK